jgi:hypothetical protein
MTARSYFRTAGFCIALLVFPARAGVNEERIALKTTLDRLQTQNPGAARAALSVVSGLLFVRSLSPGRNGLLPDRALVQYDDVSGLRPGALELLGSNEI